MTLTHEFRKRTLFLYCIVDIDVDYFGDLQNECYIPRIGPEAKLHDFGNLERALHSDENEKVVG